MHNEAPYPINSTVRVIKYRGDGKVGKQAITYYLLAQLDCRDHCLFELSLEISFT